MLHNSRRKKEKKTTTNKPQNAKKTPQNSTFVFAIQDHFLGPFHFSSLFLVNSDVIFFFHRLVSMTKYFFCFTYFSDVPLYPSSFFLKATDFFFSSAFCLLFLSLYRFSLNCQKILKLKNDFGNRMTRYSVKSFTKTTIKPNEMIIVLCAL